MVPPFGQDSHQDKTAHRAKRNGSVGTAGQNCVQPSGLNLTHGISHRISRRCASGSDYVAWTSKIEAHVEFTRDAAHYAGRNTKQTHFADLTLKIQPILLLGKLLRSAACTDDHAKSAALL